MVLRGFVALIFTLKSKKKPIVKWTFFMVFIFYSSCACLTISPHPMRAPAAPEGCDEKSSGP